MRDVDCVSDPIRFSIAQRVSIPSSPSILPSASVAGAGGSRVGVSLLTDIPSIVYNNRRDAAGCLDGSPFDLQFHVSTAFVDTVRRLSAESVRRGAARSQATAAAQVLRRIVTVETVYFDGSLPHVYVDGEGMRPIDPPKLSSLLLHEATAVLSVSVERSFPLSSAHCGKPFRLAFVFQGRELCTTPEFHVMAKMGKAGTVSRPRKQRKPAKPLSEDRATRIDWVCRSLGTCNGVVAADWPQTSAAAPAPAVLPTVGAADCSAGRTLHGRGTKRPASDSPKAQSPTCSRAVPAVPAVLQEQADATLDGALVKARATADTHATLLLSPGLAALLATLPEGQDEFPLLDAGDVAGVRFTPPLPSVDPPALAPVSSSLSSSAASLPTLEALPSPSPDVLLTEQGITLDEVFTGDFDDLFSLAADAVTW